ncbi:putative nuclease HARBI1 [Merluccius polli]|uniref:Nuclease HARBI1 n=1 Tax=Merluccius polli TaxID=89951 RepID=A0AA47MX76_MERPO|nr:putative nuclease HARBI1 [Merluccius polli]
MRLTNIVARWPWSTHDSFVLTNSSVGNRLEPGIVERAIGQLKSRWRCLDRSGGMLLYHPEKVCRIVQACGVLHNIAHRHGVLLHEVMALRRSRPRTKQCAAQCRSHSNSAAVNSKNIKKVNGDNIHFLTSSFNVSLMSFKAPVICCSRLELISLMPLILFLSPLSPFS